MATTSNPEKRSTGAFHSLRDFWARVTEGLKVSQLWGQFKSEATATYGFYSKDVDRESIDQEKSKFKRFWRPAWGLFLAMLMKLSPARRVLLIAAIILLVIHNDNFGGIWLGALILFLLLALELADRVTMKRDLEIAREIQQCLRPARPPGLAGMDIGRATRPQLA